MKSVLFALSLALAGCGSIKPVDNGPIASAGAPDPKKQESELTKKGVGSAGDAKSTTLSEGPKKVEVREFVVNPLDSRSTFQLVRYFLDPEEWILLKVTYNKDGTRTYRFQRIISNDKLPEVDPLKPPPVRTKPK